MASRRESIGGKRSSEQMHRLSLTAEVLSSCREVLRPIQNSLGARERQQIGAVVEALGRCSDVAKKGSAAFGGGKQLSQAVAKRVRTQERRESLGKGESMSGRSSRKSSEAVLEVQRFLKVDPVPLPPGAPESKRKAAGRKAAHGGAGGRGGDISRRLLDSLEAKYSAVEAVRLLSKTRRDNPALLKTVMAHLIKSEAVPVGHTRSLYKKLKVYDAGGTPRVRPWGDRGRPKEASKEDQTEILKKYQAVEGGGGTLSLGQLQKEMVDLSKKKRAARGLSNAGYKGPHMKTVMATYGEIEAREDSVVVEARPKTGSRFTAEHSLRGAGNLCATTCATHFIPGFRPAGYKVDDIDAFMGVDGSFVSPFSVLGTDDFGIILKSERKTARAGYEFVIGSKAHKGKHKTRAYFNTEKGRGDWTDTLMRVMGTCTMCAAGLISPPVLTVKGMNEREMPLAHSPDGMLVLEIAGWTAGGATDQRSTAPGYVVFLRDKGGKKDGEATAETKRFTWYRTEVFNKMVAGIREEYLGVGRDEPVPLSATAVSWIDGAYDQVWTPPTPFPSQRACPLVTRTASRRTAAHCALPDPGLAARGHHDVPPLCVRVFVSRASTESSSMKIAWSTTRGCASSTTSTAPVRRARKRPTT